MTMNECDEDLDADVLAGHTDSLGGGGRPKPGSI